MHNRRERELLMKIEGQVILRRPSPLRRVCCIHHRIARPPVLRPIHRYIVLQLLNFHRHVLDSHRLRLLRRPLEREVFGRQRGRSDRVDRKVGMRWEDKDMRIESRVLSRLVVYRVGDRGGSPRAEGVPEKSEIDGDHGECVDILRAEESDFELERRISSAARRRDLIVAHLWPCRSSELIRDGENQDIHQDGSDGCESYH